MLFLVVFFYLVFSAYRINIFSDNNKIYHNSIGAPNCIIIGAHDVWALKNAAAVRRLFPKVFETAVFPRPQQSLLPVQSGPFFPEELLPYYVLFHHHATNSRRKQTWLR